MTGWRLGYLGAPPDVAAACSKLQGQSTSGANSIAQAAGAHALNSDLKPTREMKEAFARRREIVIDGLERIPGLRVNRPQGAFYIFPDVSDFFGTSGNGYTIRNSDDLAEYLLLQAHVATVTGAAFGAPECLRISYAASEEQLREAVQRIEIALSALQ
jgi:aspartate aminotransferase